MEEINNRVSKVEGKVDLITQLFNEKVCGIHETLKSMQLTMADYAQKAEDNFATKVEMDLKLNVFKADLKFAKYFYTSVGVIIVLVFKVFSDHYSIL